VAKTTSIPVYQTPELYESALARHGQYVRWYSSLPCFCVDDVGRADPQCMVCYGKGSIYHPVVAKRTVEEGAGMKNKYIYPTGKIQSVNRVYKGDNTELSYSTYTPTYIELDVPLKSGSFYYVDYMEDLTENYTGVATYLGNGLIRVPIEMRSTIHGDFIGEIYSITYLRNVTQGNKEMQVVGHWEDLVLTLDAPDPGDVLEISCSSVYPIRMLVVGIQQKDRNENFGVIQDGDLSLTFPGYLPVGPGDLVTLLKAEQKSAVVSSYVDEQTEIEIPFFHVKEIIMIQDEIGEVTGASIIKNNKLLFGDRKPKGRFSISFTYNPTFIILDSLPSLRYGENKVFPKKVMLKRYDMFNRKEARPRSSLKYEGDVY